MSSGLARRSLGARLGANSCAFAVNGAAPQQKAVVLEELCARALKGTKERSMVEVVTALMEETTAAGWEPESAK